jgi:putative SOS response-associated peptidase YedK
LIEKIHDRMPVILNRADETRWISPQPESSLVELLRPYPREMMEAWPVSKLVNSTRHDVPGIMEEYSMIG